MLVVKEVTIMMLPSQFSVLKLKISDDGPVPGPGRGGVGGSGSVGQQGLRVPARHPGIVGQGKHSGKAGQVLLPSPWELDRVRRGEPAQLTSSSELEVLLLEQELLLGVQTSGELLVPVNSLKRRRQSVL